jgi:ribosomal protein L11 methyltransferase
VFDIGSGSGILSIAAVKLGATHAYGADIDGEATINAERNASLNEVSVQTSFLTGSVEDVLAGCFPIRQTPLVLANMIAPILTRLFGLGLADLPLPGGHLLLSGMLEEQEEAMRATIAAYGLQVVARQQIEDWVALVTKRTA